MNRRAFIAGLGGAVVWPVIARAQRSTWPIIGFLDSRSPEAVASRVRAFRECLSALFQRQRGYLHPNPLRRSPCMLRNSLDFILIDHFSSAKLVQSFPLPSNILTC